MNFVIKTKDMTEEEYAKAKAEYMAMVEEKQKRDREYYAKKKAERKDKMEELKRMFPNPPSVCDICMIRIKYPCQWYEHVLTDKHLTLHHLNSRIPDQ